MIDYEQLLSQWRDFACALWEFIEYDLRLTPFEERVFKQILEDHGMEGE